MKRTILFTSLLFLLIFLAGCSKSVTRPDANRVDGTWYVAEASRSSGYGWQYFNPGMPGVFDLYRDGMASYNDANRRMSGNWRISSEYGDHYDEDGRLRTGRHYTWRLHVSDRSSGSYIDMYFDHVVVYDQLIIATHFDGFYVMRYVFRRV